MDKKDKEKIVELKKKADDKKIYIRGLPSEVGQRNDKVNEVNRAFVEDEMVRVNAQRKAEDYLKDIEKSDEKFPRWMWFTTGVLFTVVIEVFVLETMLGDILVRFFYGG